MSEKEPKNPSTVLKGVRRRRQWQMRDSEFRLRDTKPGAFCCVACNISICLLPRNKSNREATEGDGEASVPSHLYLHFLGQALVSVSVPEPGTHQFCPGS